MRFELATAGRVVFGPGALADLGPIAVGLGRRALLVTGRTPERAGAARERLGAAGVASAVFPVASEPTVEGVRRALARARKPASEAVGGPRAGVTDG